MKKSGNETDQENIFPEENEEVISGINSNKISLKTTFAALNFKNYRLWFSGQLISLFGSWMQTTAYGYFIFELTHSPAFLGYVGFASGIPAWLLTFYGGVIADRYPRRTILMITQTWMMMLAFILAAFTFTGIVKPWHLIIISFLNGAGNAFDSTARHAFARELVGKKFLTNAIALNSTMFNTATAIGPAIAGIIYAILGPAWCFLINGVSYLAVIYNLWRIKLLVVEKPKSESSVLSEIKAGFNYLKNRKDLVTIISITSLVSFFGMGLVTLFPAWAVNILHGNSITNGYLQSARGVGAVTFALIIAAVNHIIVRGKYLRYSTAVLPLLIFIFSFNRTFIVSVLLLILIGGVLIAMFNLSNGLIQTIVDEEFRGRILSFYSFSFFALYPVGALWIGMLAEHFSSPTAVLINSVLLAASYYCIKLYHPKLNTIK
ncbi:MAG: MFS transporter [Ignavibacteria bacterium]|nr:MFS transporter [Ignavibacteria bacterium]